MFYDISNFANDVLENHGINARGVDVRNPFNEGGLGVENAEETPVLSFTPQPNFRLGL